MADLKYLVEHLIEYRAPFLVLSAEAEALSNEFVPLFGERKVHFIDCRNSMPDWHTLAKLMKDISREDGIAHFALGPNLNLELSGGLISIICDGRLPWPVMNKVTAKIVLSTSAESISELVVDEHMTEVLQEELSIAYKADHNSPYVAPGFRQAIIFFHGIGNQTATNSIEEFAEAVLPEHDDLIDKYFSLPDSTYFQLRRLIALNHSHALPGDEGILTPRNTHFYEYYWADKLQGTELSDSLIWLWKLLTRRPSSNLTAIWTLSWVLIVMAIMTTYLWATAAAGFHLPIGGLASFIIALISSVLAFAFNWFIIHYVGDAARYLSPTARNYECRENILKEGVERLKQITETGDYNRIIVVGHSLGSVVAYDVLTRLWEYNFYKPQLNPESLHSNSRWLSQMALQKLVVVADELMEQPNGKIKESLDSYQKAQVALWHEIRNQGNPWLITDLITLGSPLAHADFFDNDLERKIRQGTLPTSPPRKTEIDSNFGEASIYNELFFETIGKSDLSREILKHHALFAFTRWTNLFFPTRFAVLGDFVGGPLAPLFGRGIRDCEVSARKLLRRYSPLAHISYWAERQSKCDEVHTSTLAIDALIKTLDLNAERLGIPRTEKTNVPDSLLFRWRTEKGENEKG